LLNAETQIGRPGAFSNTKNYGKFLLGISILGSARSICCKFHSLKHEGAEGALEKSLNESQIFHWEASIGKDGSTFSGFPIIPENFYWNEPKSRVPSTSQPEFPEFFGKWKTLLV